MGLYQRFLIPFVLIALVGGGAQMLIAGQQLERATYDFYEHRIETDALMVASNLGEPMEQGQSRSADDGLQRAGTALGNDSRYDYLIADRQHNIISSSPGFSMPADGQVLPTLEHRRGDGEQMNTTIRADAAGNDRMYVSVPISFDGEAVGYLVLSQPMEPVYAEAHSRWLQLAGTTIPVIVLIAIVSLLIARTIVRPVRQLRNLALQMAQGTLDKRIDVQSSDDIGQLGQAFNFMAEQVEHLIKAQRSFVSSAAHELRTPLMTLKLRLEALADPTLDAEQKDKYLDELQREVIYMAELVDSLLVLARMDEGRHPHDSEQTDLGALLNDSARQWRIAAQRAGLTFDATIPTDLPPIAIPNAELRLIVDNLLNNAIKYTPEGSVRLSASRSGENVTIEVSDTGVGFAPDEVNLLFDRFYRSDTTRHRFPGHGLGLSIVQAVLDFYGAKINVRSEGVGRGSTFVVSLPTPAS